MPTWAAKKELGEDFITFDVSAFWAKGVFALDTFFSNVRKLVPNFRFRSIEKGFLQLWEKGKGNCSTSERVYKKSSEMTQLDLWGPVSISISKGQDENIRYARENVPKWDLFVAFFKHCVGAIYHWKEYICNIYSFVNQSSISASSKLPYGAGFWRLVTFQLDAVMECLDKKGLLIF